MRTGWRYAAAGLFIASIAAVISYRDGLFVARLAGNHDGQAYLYPFLPDGLIVVCLLALYESSRSAVARSVWAMSGLVLGIALTLAQNVYAGLAHSVLDAVLDGMVPVVFFIAAEVVLWHVRRGRGVVPSPLTPAASPGTVSSSNFEAAKARMREARDHAFTYSDTKAQADFRLTRAQVTKARQEIAKDTPAGAPPDSLLTPAGASGQGAGPRGVLAAPMNGRGHG